jgi:hypothetical protein
MRCFVRSSIAVLAAAIAVVSLSSRSAAADSQADPDNVYYEAHGIIYIRPFSNVTGVATKESEKVADRDLKFQIIGSVIADPDQLKKDPTATPTKTYYVIQFYAITSTDDPRAKDLKLSALYVTRNDNGNLFAIPKDAFDTAVTQGWIRKRFDAGITAIDVTYGATLSVPFKLRPRIEGHNRDIVTDVTLAGYFGAKWRISADHDYFFSVIGNAGLALVPISNGTNPSDGMATSTTVPAITVAAGLVFQLDSFQLGFLTGRDYASGDLGNDWIYNTKQWFSFSIGYAFLASSSDSKK